MDGTSGNEFSTTLIDHELQDPKEEESEASFGETCKPKDGGCLSISIIEEDEKKLFIRPYVRSQTPRLRWTHDLHARFVRAIERLGGQERATPKLVLHLMNVKELNIAHVKSHLQMYRSKKIGYSSGEMNHHGALVDGGDQNIYNLSKLPILHSYNKRHNSAFSSTRYENWPNVSFMGRTTGGYMPTICTGPANCDPPFSILSLNEHLRWRPHEHKEGLGSMSSQKLTRMKRKASDCILDLNLALGIKSSDERQRGLDEEGYEKE